MAITVKKTPAWVPGQGMSLSGTGPGMVVKSPGGGGGGGGLRPLVDANHIHVWNCDETSGTALVDSVGGANLTLQGSSGTDYLVGQYVGGSAIPFAKSLQSGQNYVLAQSTGLNFSSSAATLECVIHMTDLPSSFQNHTMMIMENTTSQLSIYMNTYNNGGGSPEGVKSYGGVYMPVELGWPGSTSSQYYNNGVQNITTGTTYHLMFAFDNSGGPQIADKGKFYVNGVYAARFYSEPTPISLNNMNKFSLAGLTGFNRSTPCYVRDVRVSNIARDATYAAAAYAALTT